MVSIDGSLARALEFSDAKDVRVAPRVSFRRLGLLRGPEKYQVLERRRRAAQIKARHAIDLFDQLQEEKK
jgi:hypothetical protein